MTNKKYGRVGDSPIIGCGTYANKQCAISCTGVGEQFIRNVIAHDVACLQEYKNLSLQSAADIVLQTKLEPGDGGLIAISNTGELVASFNSKGMFRGLADNTGKFEVAIWE